MANHGWGTRKFRWLAGQIPENSTPQKIGCLNGFSIATLPHRAWYWLNLTDMRVVKHLIWVPHFDPYPAALATGSSDPSDFYPQQLLDWNRNIPKILSCVQEHCLLQNVGFVQSVFFGIDSMGNPPEWRIQVKQQVSAVWGSRGPFERRPSKNGTSYIYIYILLSLHLIFTPAKHPEIQSHQIEA